MTKRSDSHLSDEYASLIHGASRGDLASLERLLLKAQDAAYRFSRTVCGGPADAEDVMQEALLKTYRHVARIRDPRAFRTWLYRTVRNACLMKRRRKAGEPQHLLPLDGLAEDGGVRPIATGRGRTPEVLALNADVRRRLRRALRDLPPQYRAVVFLREMEGLSTREVARVLEITEPNAKMRLHRARLALRAALEGS